MTILEKKSQFKEGIKIKKIIETSMIDWEGMIISTLYVGGCNFRCPFCYNTELVLDAPSLPTVTEKEILLFLSKRRSFIDGICLSGGEPTLYEDLSEFLKKIRVLNLKIKLDTNGSQPEKLEDIIEKNLVDYIAMDIKNCLRKESYAQTIGIQDEQMISRIKNSIDLLMNAGIEYEFRTTVVPGFHDSDSIEDIAREIKGVQRYVLQNFVQSVKLLNPCLKAVKPYSEEKMQEMKSIIEPYVQKCKIR